MNIGIVYRISYGNLSYIGSTIDLKQRMRSHKSNNKTCSSKEIMCYDYEVEILAEIYNMDDKKILLKLEREYMEQYKCVNKQRAIVSKEEKKEEDKQYNLKKRDKIKEYMIEYQKQHYLKNRDEKLEYRKQHYLKNRDKIKEYNIEYYLKNKNLK